MVAYYNDFSSVPFSVVYAFIVTLKRCWRKTNDIQALQVKRNKLCFEADKTSDDSVWNAFREVPNTLKTKIKSANRRFFQTALSSRNSKKIWKVIHSILNPSPQPLRHVPNKLNTHFTSTAQQTLGYQGLF